MIQSYRIARLMTTEEVVDELQLSDDDFDADEPMMPGSGRIQ